MERCEFCREYLIEGEKSKKCFDRTIDDIPHRICGQCWLVINRKFKVAGWTEEELRGTKPSSNSEGGKIMREHLTKEELKALRRKKMPDLGDAGWSTKREEDGMLSKAEIFEFGRRAGRREVVEWGNEECTGHEGYQYSLHRRQCSECWQAQLKEWGIVPPSP